MNILRLVAVAEKDATDMIAKCWQNIAQRPRKPQGTQRTWTLGNGLCKYPQRIGEKSTWKSGPKSWPTGNFQVNQMWILSAKLGEQITRVRRKIHMYVNGPICRMKKRVVTITKNDTMAVTRRKIKLQCTL